MTERRRHEHHRYLELPRHWQSEGTVQPGKLNATYAKFYDPRTGVRILWNSRQHRKRRYAPAKTQNGKPIRPQQPWWRYRLFGFDWNSISWWIAQLFLWGSVCWVVNGWFLFLPTKHDKANEYTAGYTALAGGTLFWFGAWLSVVEALNTDVEVQLPQEVHLALRHDWEVAEHKLHGSHGPNVGAAPVNQPAIAPLAQGQAASAANGSNKTLDNLSKSTKSRRKFRWWGTEWHDIGYIAVVLQFIGATLFEVSVILGVPGVLPTETATRYAVWDATFWTLQTVGAWGFIISALIFMLEVQTKWYRPSLLNMGWQVGFWNLIGAWGFEASAVFGYLAEPRDIAQRWGTTFATYWGAWAFLIGSYAQLLECLNKHPRPMMKQASEK